MKIKNEKLLPYIKWTIYYFLLILFYSLQTTPNLFEIFGIKPVLVLPLVVCVCMYEGVMTSTIYAMVAGLLWDISSDKLFGFNAIILLSCGMLISLVCIYYLRTKLINSAGFVLLTALIQGFLDFTFYYAIWDYTGSSIILFQRILPTIIYTVIVSPIFYFTIRAISKRLNIISRA